MSDEIYINTKNAPHSQLGQLGQSGTFQQPYQGQILLFKVIYKYKVIVDGQTPFTYQARYPFTYQAQDQGRYPFQATGRQPNTYQAQGRYPFTFPAIGQTPFTYQARYPYPANYTAQGRTPTNAQGTYPADAQGRYPFPYTYQARRPSPSNHQGLYPYIARRPAVPQQPYNFTQPTNTQGLFITQQPYNYQEFFEPKDPGTPVVGRRLMADLHKAVYFPSSRFRS